MPGGAGWGKFGPAMPLVTLHDLILGEGDGWAEMPVTLDVAATAAVTVSYASFNLSANSGDYQPVSGTLVIPAGQTSAVIRVRIEDDLAPEVGQSFRIAVLRVEGAGSATSQALVTIRDDDGPRGQPLLRVSDVVVDEAAGVARFAIVLDRVADGPVRVSYATADGSARAGTDYTAMSGQLEFAAGQLVQYVTVPLMNDVAAEGAEGFALVLSAPVNALLADPQAVAVIGQSDGLAVAAPVLDLADVVVDESGGFADIRLSLSAPAATAVTARLATVPGTADAGDFLASAITVTFAPGETLRTVRVALVDDAVAEPVQGFALLLADLAGARAGRDRALVTIVDDDGPRAQPLVQVADVLVDEAAGFAELVLQLDRPSAAPVSLAYATANGTALAVQDFTAQSGHVAFAPGQMLAVIRIPLVNDTLGEGSEGFAINFSQVSGAALASTSARVIIAANDAPATAAPMLLLEDAVAAEGAGFAEVVLRLSAPATSPITVRVDSVAGSAGAADFVPFTQTVTFAPGQMAKTLRVPLAADGTGEMAESFALELRQPEGALIGRGLAQVLIVDDDAAPATPQLRVQGASVDEGAGEMVFTLRLDRPAPGPVSFSYATESGSASAGADFTAISGRITLAAGAVATQLRVPISNDALREGDEFFLLRLSQLDGATSADPSAIGVIASSDAPAVALPQVTLLPAMGIEGEGFARLTLRLSAPAGTATAIRVETLADSADAADFTTISTLVQFAPGQTLASVLVPLMDDAQAEPAEAIRVELTSAQGLAVPLAVHTIALADDDALAPPAGLAQAGGSGDDLLFGQAAADVLTGADGADQLLGGAGADRLSGGEGADLLLGGAGADQLWGGVGADLFRGTLAELGGDRIGDLASGDVIQLTDLALADLAFTRFGDALRINGITLFASGSAEIRISARAAAGGATELVAGARLAASDVTGDGLADVLWRHAAGYLTHWQATGTGLVGSSAPVQQAAAGWRAAGQGDVDGDGRDDLFWRHNDGGFTYWHASVDGSFAPASFYARPGPTWQLAGIGDVTGDGRADVLWRHDDGSTTFWIGTGTGFAASPDFFTRVGTDWRLAGVADYSGDGVDDLLWRQDGGAVAMWRATGTGFVADFPLGFVAPDWRIAGSGDFDGDGFADFAWRHAGGALAVWRGGEGAWDNAGFAQHYADPAWQLAAIGDYSGDGLADLLWRHAGGGVTWWRSTGTGFDAATGFYAEVDPAWEVIPA